jgi:hypothetical protein
MYELVDDVQSLHGGSCDIFVVVRQDFHRSFRSRQGRSDPQIGLVKIIHPCRQGMRIMSVSAVTKVLGIYIKYSASSALNI